jgi:lipopolysaccharide export system protein LptC
MRNKAWLYTILLLIIIVISSWFTFIVTKNMSLPHINQATNPDTFMKNVVYTEHDQNGLIHTQIYTPTIAHYQNNDLYVFTKPQFKTVTANKQTWIITADMGKSIYGSDKIKLWHNVKIVEPELTDTHKYAFIITTNSITIYPKTKFATTEQPIIITQGENVTKAVGAEADLKAGTIKLLSKVEGTYKLKN